jgi:hypothetical protein
MDVNRPRVQFTMGFKIPYDTGNELHVFTNILMYISTNYDNMYRVLYFITRYRNVYTMYFVHVHVVYTNCTGQTKIDICTCKIILTFKQVEHAVVCCFIIKCELVVFILHVHVNGIAPVYRVKFCADGF